MKFYESTDEMQKDLGGYVVHYNTKSLYQRHGMIRQTPIKAFTERLMKPKSKERNLKTAD